MKNKFLLIITFLFILLFSIGCNKNEKNSSPKPDTGESNQTELISTIDRKIIFYVNTDLEVENIDKAIDAINGAKQPDEWFESMNVTNENARVIIRIKSDRIDQFKETLAEIGTIINYNLKASDISLDYSGTTEQIASFEAERARLLVLYENASISQMIDINKRIGEIDSELRRLNRKKNEYDSLIEYSSITININTKEEIKGETSFWSKAKNAFVGGFNVFAAFWQYVLIVILAILPFAVIIVVSMFIYRKVKKNKIIKNNKINE